MMQYRNFGKLDWKPSALGFGCMRLPLNGAGDPGNVNEAEAVRMIRHAVDSGVNYVDTAYPYHNGKSEIVTGRALAGGYRARVKLATKSPTWLIQKPDDFDRLLDEQLKRLGTDHIDFYLLHGLGGDSWKQIILKHGITARAEAAKRGGKIGHIGFSFHDGSAAFHAIVDGYDRWEFCQIQYNYLDIENQAGLDGLRYAASKGLAVVVMEPLLGGKLANPPARIRKIYDKSGTDRAPADLALQWVWDQPEVSLVLSGMSSMGQVEENLASAGRSGAGTLGRADMELIDRLREEYRAMAVIPCTKCGYCMPCPGGVDIPGNFEIYNNAYIHDDMRGARFVYSRFMGEKERAGQCTRCRACEALCPQKIEISGWMPKVHEELTGS